MNFEPEIQALLDRFENTISQGFVQYFDIDDLETIIDCYIVADQLNKARMALDYAYRIHPNSNEIHFKEGKLLLMEGKYDEAITIIESTPNIEPDYIAILAECYLRIYNFEKSKELFAQYLTKCNTNELAIIFVDIASLYNSHNQPELALEFIENGIALFPNDINILTEQAFAFEQLDRLEEASKLFTQILDLNPYQPEIWGMLGSILFRQNNFTEAIKAYDYALAINPNDINIKLQRAHCLFNLGLFNEAIEPYEDYIASNPEDAMVTTFLAETYENIENWESAQFLYKKVLKNSDYIPEAWIGLAACQHNLENIEIAYETIKIADKKFPNNHHIVHYMARIENEIANMNHDDNLLNKALNHFLFCLKTTPDDETLLFDTANIFLQFSEYRNAKNLYEKAYSINPFIEKLTLFMSMTYFALGMYDEAKKFLNIARETIANADEIFLSLFPTSKPFIKQ